ncbi:hypothetical protein PAHAL_9G013000 [Panicum hallii]|uniref:Pirin N-terminal domain-containing protein n=1 Tax=Panicum hallii TaxID=206008 RepID=A0A2S3IG88_9POAL|nr:pirin-like protein isoform X3 [Panicum hallii]PAN44047.1 hypothetical protein PAHAL_9G013000 [Panicum hallii]
MTTTMMRLRQHLASPIYTSAIARIGNRAHHHRLPIAPPQKLRTSTATQNKLLLLLIVLLVCFLFFLIPTVLLPPARTMSSSSSSASDAAAASAPFEKPRAVVKKLLAESQPEGQGATVRRSIGRHELRNLDPFLMLDEFSVSKPAGFPDHPHRGFETVTYMLEGAFTHQDFAGHKGTIRTGDVQWMTAGRGIVHSEMPAGDGVQKGLQLWINLSSKDKMIEPRYQELQSKDISRAEKDGVEVRIIAGEAFGVRSPVYTRTPTMYMDFTMPPGSELHQPVPEGWNAFVYIIDGEGVFGREKSAAVGAHHCLVLGPGDGLSVWNRSGAPLRFALVGGQPLGEPVVQHGPFVMNSRAEIQQAMEDYYYGKNGFERASQWTSSA